ncbi:MAG: segregation and condensation protein A [Planctomycetota bacterium]
MSEPGDYKVNLETFCGPMDLLLYLVRRNEVDIYDIPIAVIADQFVVYVEMMEALDIEYAAGFLVLAATLMDIKARTLVPQELITEGEEEEEFLDPREELIRELLEYKKVRDTALYLRERHDDRTHRFESGAEAPALDEKPLEEVEIWDLFAAFSTLLKQIGAGATEIVSEELPVDSYISLILEQLGKSGRLPFLALFDGARDRAAIVGMFVALLELMRQRRIRAFQEAEFGEITLELRAEAA